MSRDYIVIEKKDLPLMDDLALFALVNIDPFGNKKPSGITNIAQNKFLMEVHDVTLVPKDFKNGLLNENQAETIAESYGWASQSEEMDRKMMDFLTGGKYSRGERIEFEDIDPVKYKEYLILGGKSVKSADKEVDKLKKDKETKDKDKVKVK